MDIFFYDSFISDRGIYPYDYPYVFDRFVYNDNNNTIILLGQYYSYFTELDDYEFEEFLDVFYGGWYDFSA